MRIYLAGPLFTSAERAWNAQLAQHLAALGHDVFLPQDREPAERGARAIFETDRDGIDWCDVVVAIMDGAEPDAGTCWECGYAYRKKRLVLVRTDFRVRGADVGPYNPMLTQSADVHLELPRARVDEVACRVDEALGSLGAC